MGTCSNLCCEDFYQWLVQNYIMYDIFYSLHASERSASEAPWKPDVAVAEFNYERTHRMEYCHG